ncbi:hypothetical protein L1765_11230 [Microaerobacter geothermalis]|uniref:hypothetical protein n=1 Tax=Microaerobacter geothermalis TaxID=674972 RepID=UPI001F33CECB|nr:hypothetical protein [Microaerobacter geothermalis]MCF6094535.1 hypothetical protein [Microaerobacter geothermalis]
MIISAFTDGIALYCVIPSKSRSGVYVVEVKPENERLIVSHACPAHRFKTKCTHVEEAISCYRQWRWWEFAPWLPQKEIVPINRHITLQPQWEQIPVPGSEAEIISIVKEVECHAS